MNHVRAIGLTCLVVGVLIFATPTFGFSLIDSERGTNVNVAGDGESFLGITDRSDEGIVIRGTDPGTIFELVDNLPGLATPEAAIIEYAGQSHPPLLTTVIDEGSHWAVEVACDPNTGMREMDTMTFHIVTQSGMSIEMDRETGMAIETRCGGQIRGESGFVSVTVSDLVFGDDSQTQTAEFHLSNDLGTQETVEIDFILVQAGQRLDYEAVDLSVNFPGQISDRHPGNRYIIEFTATQPINSGETVVITIENVDASGNQAAGGYDVEFQKEGEEGSRLTTFEVVEDE